jgi:hypothetical protein
MWKPPRRTKSKSPYSWNPCTTQIIERYLLWDTNYVSSLMSKTLLGSIEWIKHKITSIDKLILSRFLDLFESLVLKGRIMRIKEQGSHWQIVSCRSNRREHLSNSFIVWTKPKGLGHVTVSASYIYMAWKQGKLFTIWQHIWHVIMSLGYEENWSQKSHVGTSFNSAGRMDSGPMFQTRTQPHQYQYLIMQAI